MENIYVENINIINVNQNNLFELIRKDQVGNLYVYNDIQYLHIKQRDKWCYCDGTVWIEIAESEDNNFLINILNNELLMNQNLINDLNIIKQNFDNINIINIQLQTMLNMKNNDYELLNKKYEDLHEAYSILKNINIFNNNDNQNNTEVIDSSTNTDFDIKKTIDSSTNTELELMNEMEEYKKKIDELKEYVRSLEKRELESKNQNKTNHILIERLTNELNLEKEKNNNLEQTINTKSEEYINIFNCYEILKNKYDEIYNNNNVKSNKLTNEYNTERNKNKKIEQILNKKNEEHNILLAEYEDLKIFSSSLLDKIDELESNLENANNLLNNENIEWNKIVRLKVIQKEIMENEKNILIKELNDKLEFQKKEHRHLFNQYLERFKILVDFIKENMDILGEEKINNLPEMMTRYFKK